jgi:hypothetical protein
MTLNQLKKEILKNQGSVFDTPSDYKKFEMALNEAINLLGVKEVLQEFGWSERGAEDIIFSIL